MNATVWLNSHVAKTPSGEDVPGEIMVRPWGSNGDPNYVEIFVDWGEDSTISLTLTNERAVELAAKIMASVS